MIGFIGYGNLASAVVSGFLDKSVLEPSDITVFVKSDATKQKAKNSGFFVAEDINSLIKASDTVVLAVKPYVFAELLSGIDTKLLEGKTVVSFMACYLLEKLENDLGNCRIVRVIPTIAARFCDDCIALASNAPDVSDIVELFENLGEVHHVKEDMLDRIMIGASSGLGFAAEIMSMYERAVMEMGISKELAHAITAKTFANAANFDDFDDLAAKVATKGGVTEKGLFVMREENMAQIVKNAILTAEKVIK